MASHRFRVLAAARNLFQPPALSMPYTEPGTGVLCGLAIDDSRRSRLP